MSKAWATGHGRPWARIRQAVLERDGWVCQLCKEPIDRMLRKPDPMAAHVHHVVGRSRSGDDMRYLVSAHAKCNLEAGDPTRTSPRGVSRTTW